MKRSMIFVLMAMFCFSLLFSGPENIRSRVEGMKAYPGYFLFYWDEQSGKIWLEIDKFDQDFLYVTSLAAGLGSNDVGLDRNQLGRSRIVRFVRIGPKVLLIQANTSFRAGSGDPDEQKAVEDAFARSVLGGFSVVSEEDGKVLVDATSFFLRDAQNVIGALKRRGQGAYRLDPSRSAVYLANTRNFPFNTEIEALLTFAAGQAGRLVQQVAADPLSITLREHHSFVRLPDNAYEPRAYDPRASFGALSYRDYSTEVGNSLIKRFIIRHRLKKKDPKAAVSDPVKPIVYYVDRAIPEPIRSAVIEGAGWWNQAFEALGYRNAFQVKVLPKGADPLDVRYNMINWVHRSSRGWSYGSSVVDPRTGEIIKGHVSLGSLRIRQDFLIAQGLVGDYGAVKDNSAEMREMALARIRQLACHEVGHTLGLGHNYASSVNERASVMDYPHPLIRIKPDGSLDFSSAYARGVGEWDKVSIAYGYQDYPSGTDVAPKLRAILDDAFSQGLIFLASQDAGPASAQPQAAVWDNGRNAVDELGRVMKIRRIALDTFSERRIPFHTPLALLEEVLAPVYLFHRYQVEAAASFLGGMSYNYQVRGGVQKEPRIVPGPQQRRALEALLKTIKPENLVIDEKILNLLPPHPQGYGRGEIFPGRTGLVFDDLGAVESGASLTFDVLLHPARASRLIEFHARKPECPGLEEVIERMTKATWKTSRKNGHLAEIQRTVDFVFMNALMRLVASDETLPQAKAAAFFKLDELKRWLKAQKDQTVTPEQKAHYFYGASLIEEFEKAPGDFKLKETARPPQGAPIGSWR